MKTNTLVMLLTLELAACASPPPASVSTVLFDPSLAKKHKIESTVDPQPISGSALALAEIIREPETVSYEADREIASAKESANRSLPECKARFTYILLRPARNEAVAELLTGNKTWSPETVVTARRTKLGDDVLGRGSRIEVSCSDLRPLWGRLKFAFVKNVRANLNRALLARYEYLGYAERVHEVRAEENLKQISKYHLGKTSRWLELYVLNPSIKDASVLVPGAKLRFFAPAEGSADALRAPTSAPPTAKH